MGIIQRVFGGGKSRKSVGSFYQTLYPEGVRYALSHRGAQMGPAEIRSLVDRFTIEALYLVVKALDDPELKRQYIEDLARLFVKPDYVVNDLKECLYDWIDKIPAGTHVKGTKLAQLSRSGNEKWQDNFKSLAKSCFDEDNTALPCLIAHTAILGFQHFVQTYSDTPNAHIILLVPEWMVDPESQIMGYDVKLGPEPTVRFETKDTCLVGAWTCLKADCRFNHRYCGNSFFVDDTIHTGKTAGKMISFWYSEYGLNIPESKIKVITDLREQAG